jgi:toxin ParE1/3/4
MSVRWTDLATHDLTNICDYTRERHGPDMARKLAWRIHEATGSLLQFHHRGRSGRKPGTRELVLAGSPFLAVYRIREDVIEIVRILHGAQRWP